MKLIQPCPDAGGYRKFAWKTGSKIHLGHDYNAKEGTIVKAVADGKVIFSGDVNGFGSYGKKGGVIIIEHEDFVALYGHIKRKIEVGDIIKQGDVIGSLIIYQTSEFRADHLHFGINVKKEIPKGNWGYSEDAGTWTDPIFFIENSL